MDATILGLPDVADADLDVNALLRGFDRCTRGEAYLAWTEFRIAGELHARLVEPVAESDVSLIDAYAQCAARIAIAHAMSQRAAEQLVADAVALRDRLPQVATCLRDGLLTRRQTTTIVARTALAEGKDYALEVDRKIAGEIRGRRGVWSMWAIRDLADRIIFRHDPNAIRERRRRALGERALWTEDDGEGVAVISASMRAENTRLAAASVRALASCVCKSDPRPVRARNSDAEFALLSRTRFECLCGRDTCDAQIPAVGQLPPGVANIVIHVICEQQTLVDPSDTTPAILDGHGVISADHARELADRPDAVLHRIGRNDVTAEDREITRTREGTSEAPDAPGSASRRKRESFVAERDFAQTAARPPHLPSDPYRPSAALNLFLRARDIRCAVPGCTRSAFDCDLDHVREYDHADPSAGGRTEPAGMNTKCRFHHLLKTFGEFVDDQILVDGRPQTTFITPEGLVLAGRADSGLDVLPTLAAIRFRSPGPADPARTLAGGSDPPRRPSPRTVHRHARRERERRRNRDANTAGPPPPF